MRKDLIELRRLYNGFQASRIILTANNLGVFDHLKKPKSARGLAKALRADLRAVELLLNALTAIGLLGKRKNSYLNAPTANRYLLKDSPHYQGNILRHIDTLWKNWSMLDDVVRTGKPSRMASDHASFIMGMHNLSVLKARKILGAVGLRGVKTALDLGAGPGTYSIEMARRGISVTLFDTPDTIKIARKVAREAGVKGIRFKGGDFFVDDIGGGYDLILISQIFHAYSEEMNVSLLKKCRAALNPGGRVVVQEFPLNEDRTSPLQGALFAINMLVHTEGGRTYTPREMGGWLRGAGLERVNSMNLEDNLLISGAAPRK
jgi:2-polyprenyl-3-methyl-5-hydroxy-6-metoxy-1,4-benzoquinol methylase